MPAAFQPAPIAMVQLQSPAGFVNVDYCAEPWRIGSCVMLLGMPGAARLCTMRSRLLEETHIKRHILVGSLELAFRIAP
jgi:hypothetical protein